jgi:hypothetical protein
MLHESPRDLKVMRMLCFSVCSGTPGFCCFDYMHCRGVGEVAANVHQL